MNFLALCHDYHVETAGPEHHHVSKGWIGVHCPFCPGPKNFHLGFNVAKEFFHCWRCGGHTLRDTLERLTGETFGFLWEKYGEGRSAPSPARRVFDRPKQQKELILPIGFTVPLLKHHRRYLERRGFDPDELIEEWGVCSTSPIAIIRTPDGEQKHYGNRIFIPVYWEGRLATFQCRSMKPKNNDAKYKACPVEMEARSIRHVLYRHPEATSDHGICVEGATDVWRMGHHAFAMLGIGYSELQISLIASLYRHVLILFDPDQPGQERAEKIRSDLGAWGVKSDVHTLPDDRDPAQLTPSEASLLVKHLLS